MNRVWRKGMAHKTGDRVGPFTIVRRAGTSTDNKPLYEGRCDHGRTVAKTALQMHRTKTCPCERRRANTGPEGLLAKLIIPGRGRHHVSSRTRTIWGNNGEETITITCPGGDRCLCGPGIDLDHWYMRGNPRQVQFEGVFLPSHTAVYRAVFGTSPNRLFGCAEDPACVSPFHALPQRIEALQDAPGYIEPALVGEQWSLSNGHKGQVNLKAETAGEAATRWLRAHDPDGDW